MRGEERKGEKRKKSPVSSLVAFDLGDSGQ